MRAWSALIASGLLEAVWAHALPHVSSLGSALFVFLAACAGSVAGLYLAVRTIPVGTAYAVWSGIGAATTAVWGGLTGEPLNPWHWLFLAIIVTGIVGLQLVSTHGSAPESAKDSA